MNDGKEELSLEQMKEIQIGILDFFADVCKKNDIKWWIEFGTLLGAVRHKGFIPWDDDIDVAMLREDYESLKVVFNEQSQIYTGGRYKLLDPEIDKEYKYSFGKVIDTKTILLEGDREFIKSGVYIDVFAYDAAPSDEAEYKKMLKRRDYLGKLRTIKLFEFDKKNITVRTIIAFARKLLLTPLSMSEILSSMQKNAKRYMGVKTGKIADFLWPYGNFCFYLEEDYFDNLIEVEFEGRLFPAPENYDRWLRLNYGNYMELPPVEQRVQHKVKAFYV